MPKTPPIIKEFDELEDEIIQSFNFIESFQDRVKFARKITKKFQDQRADLLRKIEEGIEKIPNVNIITKRGNIDTKIQLQAKFTKDIKTLLGKIL